MSRYGKPDYRDKAYELVEEGLVSADTMITACLKYMSQDEVKDMLHHNELLIHEDEFEDGDPRLTGKQNKELGYI